jgi:hypothetical protein
LILDTNLRLEAVLAGAITTSQPEYHVCFVDWNQNAETTPPAVSRGALNSTSDVTILAAPGSVNPRREVQKLVIYNKDTVSATVTVKTDDGTTERIERKRRCLAGIALLGKGRWLVRRDRLPLGRSSLVEAAHTLPRQAAHESMCKRSAAVAVDAVAMAALRVQLAVRRPLAP